MEFAQIIINGITIRQDFSRSVRFVMFATGVDGWEYATHGGTAFVVNFRGKLFGLTCRHVLTDFNWSQLAITEARFGTQLAGLKAIYYPSDPRGEAVDTDIFDVAVIEFADHVAASFFTDPAYIINANTCGGGSREGDVLRVNGVLKEKSDLSGPEIAPVFALLDFVDRGATSTDPSLREAYVEFALPDFTSVTGISGSPVFNVTTGKLCGMTVRAGLVKRACTLWYIDIVDIMYLLDAIVSGRPETNYQKTILRRLPDTAAQPPGTGALSE